jgi:hypothetical protein
MERENRPNREKRVSPRSLAAQWVWGFLTFSRFLGGESPLERRGEEKGRRSLCMYLYF